MRTVLVVYCLRMFNLTFVDEVQRSWEKAGGPKVEGSVNVCGATFTGVFRVENRWLTLLLDEYLKTVKRALLCNDLRFEGLGMRHSTALPSRILKRAPQSPVLSEYALTS